jgi:hypothetical protein
MAVVIQIIKKTTITAEEWGFVNKVKLNIESNNDIFKVGNRTFQFGHINYDNNFINIFISILDLGLKFVPSFYFNSFQLFLFFLKNIETEMVNFNKRFTINTWREINKNKNSNLLSETVLDEPENDCENELFSQQNIVNFDLVFKKFEKKRDPLNYKNRKECLDFKYSFFDYFSDLSFSNNYNLSFEQINILKHYIKHKPFSVIECDKNIGTCLISNENLNELCLEHLSNEKIYKKFLSNPLEETMNKIKDEISSLYINDHISDKVFKVLLNNSPVIGKFRVLAKLHKNKFGLRPIINCINTPTYNLCKLVEYILHPFIKNFISFIQDSQNLIQDLDDRYFPSKVKFISADFESLYTNIDLNLALNIITDFSKDKLDESHINIYAFNKILRLIFENNIFCFKESYYVQILGIAMGSVCGPTIANIFVNFFEEKWLTIAKPIYYKRFIDDLFIILLDNNSFDFQLLHDSFKPLKLNVVCNERVNFLDLDISFNNILRKVNFKLFLKKTNSFSYLLTSSNHPQHIFKNIPKSIFLRVKKNCSSFLDYLYFSTLILNQLLLCGYEFNFLMKVLNTVDRIDRKTLIPYKNKNENIFLKNDILIFKLPYDFNIIHDKTSFQKIKNFFNETYRYDLKIKFFYSIQSNDGVKAVPGY